MVFESVFFEALFEIGRGLVVENVNLRLIAAFHEAFVDMRPTAFYFRSGFALEWGVEDPVAVLVVDNQQVFVASGGAMWKPASQVVICRVLKIKSNNLGTCRISFDVGCLR